MALSLAATAAAPTIDCRASARVVRSTRLRFTAAADDDDDDAAAADDDDDAAAASSSSSSSSSGEACDATAALAWALAAARSEER
jgi:hypothetical protein